MLGQLCLLMDCVPGAEGRGAHQHLPGQCCGLGLRPSFCGRGRWGQLVALCSARAWDRGTSSKALLIGPIHPQVHLVMRNVPKATVRLPAAEGWAPSICLGLWEQGLPVE